MLSTYLVVTSCLMLHSEALNPVKRINKIQPAVTNSIINLGKIDVAFYLHPTDKDQLFPVSRQPARDLFPISSSFLQPQSDAPCPCSGMQNVNKAGYADSPPSLLNKLLMNNELFTFREPTISMECCESQELVEQNSFLFDFGNTNPFSFPRPAAQLPFLKPKQLEIFMMPHKAPLAPKSDYVFLSENYKPQKKEEPIVHKDQISVVGDKQIKLDFDVLTSNNEKTNSKTKSFDTAHDKQMTNDIKLDFEVLTPNNEKTNSKTKPLVSSLHISPTGDRYSA